MSASIASSDESIVSVFDLFTFARKIVSHRVKYAMTNVREHEKTTRVDSTTKEVVEREKLRVRRLLMKLKNDRDSRREFRKFVHDYDVEILSIEQCVSDLRRVVDDDEFDKMSDSAKADSIARSKTLAHEIITRRVDDDEFVDFIEANARIVIVEVACKVQAMQILKEQDYVLRCDFVDDSIDVRQREHVDSQNRIVDSEFDERNEFRRKAFAASTTEQANAAKRKSMNAAVARANEAAKNTSRVVVALTREQKLHAMKQHTKSAEIADLRLESKMFLDERQRLYAANSCEENLLALREAESLYARFHATTTFRQTLTAVATSTAEAKRLASLNVVVATDDVSSLQRLFHVCSICHRFECRDRTIHDKYVD